MKKDIQLALSIGLKDEATFESYFPEENGQAFIDVKKLSIGHGEQFIFLYGSKGVGKTHLLQAACRNAEDHYIPAFYISLDNIDDLSTEIFDGLEQLDLICIDNIQNIAGNISWEEKLFHLFNKAKDNNCKLILASALPLNSLEIKLQDLKSRLTWGVTYKLKTLSDLAKVSALQLRASFRGFKLDEVTGKFLLNHCPRNMTELFNILEKLDLASLREQRKLTVPFIKEVLGV